MIREAATAVAKSKQTEKRWRTPADRCYHVLERDGEWRSGGRCPDKSQVKSANRTWKRAQKNKTTVQDTKRNRKYEPTQRAHYLDQRQYKPPERGVQSY
jgi:hypothetical protein